MVRSFVLFLTKLFVTLYVYIHSTNSVSLTLCICLQAVASHSAMSNKYTK